MLSAAPARPAVQCCSGAASLKNRVLTSLLDLRCCPCQIRNICLQPSSTATRRRKLGHGAKSRRPTSCAAAQTERPGTSADHNGFEWVTNVSRHGNVYFAIDETSQACLASMGDSAAEPTVALFFAASSYAVEFDRIIPVLRSKVPSLQHIVGCTVRIW